MLTPQEVSEHVFAKASFGGYHMAMVDEFLDVITEDYTALYKENAILKSKMKVLADKIEEYRSTEEAMRKTLLTAQRMADEMVKEAEKKRDLLVASAEMEARKQIEAYRHEAESEQERLNTAKEATAAYLEKARAMHEEELARLTNLGQAPFTAPDAEDHTDPTAQEFDASAQHTAAEKEELAQPTPAAVAAPMGNAPTEDDAPTRRLNLNDLQFGKDFQIR